MAESGAWQNAFSRRIEWRFAESCLSDPTNIACSQHTTTLFLVCSGLPPTPSTFHSIIAVRKYLHFGTSSVFCEPVSYHWGNRLPIREQPRFLEPIEWFSVRHETDQAGTDQAPLERKESSNLLTTPRGTPVWSRAISDSQHNSGCFCNCAIVSGRSPVS